MWAIQFNYFQRPVRMALQRKIRPISSSSRPENFRKKASLKSVNLASMFKKMQYLLIILICTVVLLFQVAKCIDKYRDKNTGTADKYIHVSKASFPELTICPTYPYRLDVLQANGIATKNDLRFGSQWISNDTMVRFLKESNCLMH